MKNSQLDKIISKADELEIKLQDPSIIKDSNLFKNLSTEYAEISPQAEIARKLNKLLKEEQDSYFIQENETDDDMKKLCKSELSRIKKQKKLLEEELNKLLETIDPNDRRNVILEIRAGTGGEEAALFTKDLFRMYTRYAERNNWQVKQLSANYAGSGGLKEIIINIIGANAYGKFKYESGVHRVQRIPKTESSGRIHTSAASVVILPEIEDIPEIQINENEIKIDVYRSTGPGGQSVNTTDSAVRITHIPTNIVVTCQDEKSQHKNKARAISILKSKLFQMKQEELMSKQADTRQNAIRGGDRSVKIKTYNFPQGRLTDHRIKKTWHNLAAIMDGEIEQILEETKEKISDANVI